jgi:hypothetical protein
MGAGSISREFSGRGVVLTNHLHLAPGLKKEYSYTSTPRLKLHGLFYGELYLLHEVSLQFRNSAHPPCCYFILIVAVKYSQLLQTFK